MTKETRENLRGWTTIGVIALLVFGLVVWIGYFSFWEWAIWVVKQFIVMDYHVAQFLSSAPVIGRWANGFQYEVAALANSTRLTEVDSTVVKVIWYTIFGFIAIYLVLMWILGVILGILQRTGVSSATVAPATVRGAVGQGVVLVLVVVGMAAFFPWVFGQYIPTVDQLNADKFLSKDMPDNGLTTVTQASKLAGAYAAMVSQETVHSTKAQQARTMLGDWCGYELSLSQPEVGAAQVMQRIVDLNIACTQQAMDQVAADRRAALARGTWWDQLMATVAKSMFIALVVAAIVTNIILSTRRRRFPMIQWVVVGIALVVAISYFAIPHGYYAAFGLIMIALAIWLSERLFGVIGRIRLRP